MTAGARRLTGLALALAAACPAAAAAAPTLAQAGGDPLPWLATEQAPIAWVQQDVGDANGPVLVQVNLTQEGTTGPARWQTRVIVPNPLAPGMAGVLLPVGDLEGRHAVRVVLLGAAGSPLSIGVVRLDRTAPAASDAAIAPAPDDPAAVEASWTQSDAQSGTATVVVEVNDSPAGDGSGDWAPFDVQATPPWDGPHRARTTTAALPEGIHLVRARSVDHAGNAGEAALGTIVVDRTPPTVEILSAVRGTGPSGPTVSLTYRAADPEPGWGIAPGAPITVSGPGGAPIYAQQAGGPGQHVIEVPLPPSAAGPLVARIADRGGAVGESAPVAPTDPAGAPLGAASNAQDPFERFRGARVTVEMPGARSLPGAGLVRRVSGGAALPLAGLVADRDGRALARAQVEVRDAAGRALGTALTGTDGRFHRRVRPGASGALSFVVPSAAGALPLAAAVRSVVQVVPRLTVAASAGQVRFGEPVTLRGRFLPTPSALGAGARKTVDLEYLDPSRGIWRSGITARLRPDGSFTASWTPPSPGLLRVRALVRQEVAWPFRHLRSRSVPVLVR